MLGRKGRLRSTGNPDEFGECSSSLVDALSEYAFYTVDVMIRSLIA
jgi:hypothetical protein